MANVCTDENRKIILDNIFKFFRKNKGSNATIENLDLFIGSVFPNTDPAQFRVAHYATDEGIANMLEKFNVDVKTLLSTADRLVEPKSNVIESTASSEITDMFHGIPAGELFFRGRVNRQVSVNAWLGRPDAKTYVGDTETVSKNMQELKNDLFMNIQNFLISKNLLEGVKSARELFNGGEVDYDYYKKVMKTAGEFFFEGDFTMLNSYTNKKVPDISDGVAITDVIYEVYSDLIFLANFDSVIAKQFGHMIQISILDVDNLKGNVKHDKYKLKSSPESNMYWSNNSHSEEGVQSANFKLAEMIVNTIPAYDKKGNKTTHYMENKDMYLLAAIIAQFELLHGNELLNDDASGYQYLAENSPEQFEWYLENIMESFRDRGTHAAILKQAFLPYANIIHSLYNFMHDETLNIAAKEKTADITVKEILGQILTNTYGAVYHIYNSDQLTIQQMFSQDFNATGIHNTVLSNMRTKVHDVNYFQIDPKKSQSGNANFEALFEGVDLSQDITELIGSNINFTNQLGKYLYDKLGIKIDRDTLLDTAHELIAGTAHEIPTVGFFKTAMWNTLSKMNDDFVRNVIGADRTGMTEDQIAKEDAKAANFDSTAGKIISETVSSKFYNALLTSYLLKYPVKAVSTITTMSGEAIPAFKLANMTYKDTDLFSTQRKFEKNNNNHYRNMFIAGKAVIKGTSTRLEIVNDIKLDNMKPVNKSAGKMIAIESFMADFNYDFLDNITKEKDASFNVMIGNYSDKSTILTKIIDAGWSDTENGVPLLKQDISAIIEKVRTQGMNYYRDALKGVFDTYGELFKSAGISHSALLFDVNNPASFEASVAEINRILANNDIKQIIAAANRPDIKIIEELHYSKYKSGFSMNQVLTDNYRIFSDPKRFDKFVDLQEKSFENKYTAHDGSFGINNTPFARINRKHLTALNLQDYKYDFTKLRAVDGEFNPVVRKWMWMNALARNEYLFMSTKGEYMHPQNYSQNTVDHRLVEIKGESNNTTDTAAYIESYTPAATKTTPAEIIAEMKKVAKNSDDIKLNAEKTHYVSKKDPKKKYQRVSDFISEGNKPDENDPLIKSALNIGNLVDVLVRDFFDDKNMAKLDSYGISPELIKPFLEQLEIVKANMDSRGEKVIANDVTLYDDELMIAGTVDLITYDPEGNVRIYDMKTMRGDQLKTQYYADVRKNNGLSKYDSNIFGISNREKHTRQLSLYNILLNKTHGIKATTLGVMPIEVDYTPGDKTTKRLKLLPGIKIDIRNNVKSAKLEKESLYTVNRVKSFNRALVEADKDRVYLFGDNTDDRLNTKYVPKSTQAVIRGLPNAIGIDTKKNRGTNEGSSVNEITVEKASKKTKISALMSGYELNIKGISGIRAYITNESSKEWEAFSITNSGKVFKMGDGKTMKDTIQKVQDNFNSALKDPEKRGKLLTTLEINLESSYFTDADFDQFKRQVDEAIKQAKESGKIIVIPTDGIGTGKAELEKRAPKLFAYLTQQLNSIEDGTAGKPRDVIREAVKSVNFASDFSEDYWEDYFKEVGERLIVMSKRNVANTATFENALRNSRLGTDNIINHATVEDFRTAPFSITGEKKYKTKDGKIIAGQDAHDGSSYLSYIHSKMIDASYPGKGYEGTKKRFGTIVTEHGVMVKKDAESEITNRKIRNSESAEIPFYQLKKKMESLPINDLNLGFEKEYFDEHYFDHLNTIYQIKKVKLYKSGDQHYIDLDTIHVNKQGQPERGIKTFPVNSLFEMWEVFGAQHSSDENGNYTEGSNDLVYDVVVGAVNNKLVNGLPTAQYGALKQKLIHIVSNKSAVKSGATNLNSIDIWTTDAPLSYATFETAFMGPQLDASHDVEDSNIREITQIISALAQNGYTSEWAREAYEDIQNIIQDASVPYMKHLTGLKEINMSTEESKKKFYRYLSDRFINSIHKTQGNNIAKTLVAGLRQDGVQIPFSNQNFYSAFVKDIITRMNTDFISRNYPGIGAVLTPSEGIIQMYDVFVNGDLIAVTHEDLSKEALRNYNEASYKRQYGEVPKNNTEVIRNYIQQTLRDSDILLQDIEIGDIIRVDGVEYNLKTPEDYYEFKRIYSKNEVSDVLANNPELARIGSRAANLSADGKGSYLAEDLYARYRGGESFLEDYSPDTDTVVRTPIKKKYKGKLIVAQSGTGKTSIADNISVIDSDLLLANILDVPINLAMNAFRLLSPEDRNKISLQYHQSMRDEVAKGNTVITANLKMLGEADLVVYNESASLTDERTGNIDRTNRYTNSEYQKKSLETIKQAVEAGKEAIVLNGDNFLSDVLLDDPNFTIAEEIIRNDFDTLDQVVTNFMDKFGVTIDEFSESGYSMDLLEKTIKASKPGEITDASGEMIAFMMQWNGTAQKIITDLAIKDGVLAKEVAYNAEGKIRSNPYKSLHKEKYIAILGKSIAQELRHQYETISQGKKIDSSTPKKSFLTKVKNIIKDFFTAVEGDDKVITELAAFSRHIAINVLKGNESMVQASLLKPGDAASGRVSKVDLKTALDDNPYETGIIKRLSNHNIVLAGSAAMATQIDIFRPAENPLHDIDFSAPGDMTKQALEAILDSEFPFNTHIRTIEGKDRDKVPTGEFTETYIILDREFTIQPVEGTKQFKLIGTDGTELGWFQDSNLTLNPGVKGKFLDFFLYSKDAYPPIEFTHEGDSFLISDYRSAMRVKIEWARLKDIWDYNRYVRKQPLNSTNSRSKVAPTIQRPSQRPPIVGSKLDIIGFSNFMDSLEGQIISPRANKKVSPTIDNNRTYFKKVHNKPRDLKPTLHKFTHNGTNYNIFDLQSIKFRYYLENLSDLTLKGRIEPSELETFNNLLTYINNFYLGGNELIDADSVVNNPKMVKLVKKFLSGWTQRNLGLLENNLIMDRVNANTDFHEYFKGDDVIATALPDVIDKYKNNKVTNVKFRAAELILGDIYKGMFDRTDNESMYEVFKKGEQFFADKILKNYENDPVEADLKIITSKMANPVYVRFVEELPRSENNVPLRRFIDERGIDETRNYARFDNNNQPIYQVPDMNNVVVNSENGSDVVYIKWSHDSFEGVHTMQYTFNKTVDRFFKSFGDGLKTVVPLMRENSQFQVRNEDQTTRVFDINQLSLDLFNKNMNLNFKMDLKKGEVFNRQKDIASLLGRRVFASWQKSHEVVSARIPAQSMQSFMPMRNVAYNLGGKNDAYVSISQIWLQGSDFDIDKAYILGYSFNSKGNYNSWSSLTDYSSKEQLDALNLLPKANNQTVTIGNTKTAVDMSSLYNELMSSRFVQDPESLDADSIKIFNRMIRKINKAKSNEISFTGVKEDLHFNFNVVAELINRHNNPKGGRDYTNSLKNKVSAKIQQIISAPSNQLVANSPITISDWHRTVDEVLERRKSLEEVHPAVESLFEDVNSKNQFTNKGILDESTLGELSVMLEKKHPGLEMVHLPTGQGNIIAVLKAGQTIEQYIEAKKADSASVIFYTPKFLNGMLKNKRRYERQITTTLSPYDGMSYYIMQQNASVGKEDVGIAANGVKSFFALTDYFNDFYNNSSEMTAEELMKSNQMFQVDFVFKVPLSEDINFKSNTISDLQIRNADSEKIRSVLNSQFKQKFSNAALILSGLLSAATDNAKELLMAKINATPDLFSMHLYMAVLGMDMDQIVEIMTSDVANDVVKRTENNLFVNKHSKGIAKIFTELHDGYTKRGQTEQAHNILVFKQIYESSKEFSSLAGLLGINQKRKANTWEIYNYLTRLEKLFRETTKNRFEDLKLDKAPFTDDSKANVVARILEINPVMKNYPDHVAKIVNQASNIAVEYTDFDGQIRKKSVNVILDGMDFRLYLKDEKYKKIVKDYYNLIKHTFNVFDVVDNVPHFKGMIDSLILTHDVLLNSSEKYKFVYGKVQDIVNIGHTLNDNFKKNHVDQKTVNSASTFFDGAVIEKWLRDEMGHINFNVKDIMKLAEVDTYNVYISDLVKDRVNPGGQDPSAQVVKKGDSSNPVITLNSTYNIAMFKKIMEDMILPIIQKKTNSEFLESLKIESVVNNFGIKSPTIVSIHSLQELNTPVSIDQYQKLLKDFDFLDSDEKLKGLFKNNVGTEIKIRDMFFLYNLIVHNEKYGNKKLTPLMENYMKERTSLGYKYLEYYSKVDKGEVDIWEDMKIKYGDGWKEQLENNIFFHINSYRGSAVITRNGKRITMRITNPHITMMTDVNYVRDFGKNYTDINDILSLIRENGWAVNLKC